MTSHCYYPARRIFKTTVLWTICILDAVTLLGIAFENGKLGRIFNLDKEGVTDFTKIGPFTGPQKLEKLTLLKIKNEK